MVKCFKYMYLAAGLNPTWAKTGKLSLQPAVNLLLWKVKDTERRGLGITSHMLLPKTQGRPISIPATMLWDSFALPFTSTSV